MADHLPQVRGEMDLLALPEGAALHLLVDYDRSDAEARPLPAILLSAAHMYDMGMKAATCVEHVAEVAEFSRRCQSAETAPHSAGVAAVGIGGVREVPTHSMQATTVDMALENLSSDARLVLDVLARVCMEYIPLPFVWTLVASIRGIKLSTPLDYADKELDEAAAWVVEELVDRFQLLTRRGECRVRRSAPAAPTLVLDGAVRDHLNNHAVRVHPREDCAAAALVFVTAAMTDLPTDLDTLISHLADDPHVFLLANAAVVLLHTYGIAETAAVPALAVESTAMERLATVALGTSRMLHLLGCTPLAQIVCDWGQSASVSPPVHSLQFAALHSAMDGGRSVGHTVGAEWSALAKWVRPTALRPELHDADVEHVEAIMSAVDVVFTRIRKDSIGLIIERCQRGLPDSSVLQPLFPTRYSDPSAMVEAAAIALLELGCAGVTVVILRVLMTRRLERTQLPPNTGRLAATQCLLAVALGASGTVNAADDAFRIALEGLGSGKSPAPRALTFATALLFWQRGVLHLRESRLDAAKLDLTNVLTILSAAEPAAVGQEESPSAAVAWYARVRLVETHCALLEIDSAQTVYADFVRLLPADITIDTDNGEMPPLTTLPVFALRMMNGALAATLNDWQLAADMYVCSPLSLPLTSTGWLISPLCFHPRWHLCESLLVCVLTYLVSYCRLRRFGAAYDGANSDQGQRAVLAGERARSLVQYANAVSLCNGTHESLAILADAEDMLLKCKTDALRTLPPFVMAVDANMGEEDISDIVERLVCVNELAAVYACRGDVLCRIDDYSEGRRFLIKATSVLGKLRGAAGSMEIVAIRERIARATAEVEEDGPDAALPLAKSALATRRRLARRYGLF
jgi:hypothetical protein